MILALDSGTTRTRVWVLAEGREPFVGASEIVGARDLARTRDREWLARRVHDVAEAALDAADATWGEVEAVVMFGMITSELGLVEVPHLVAPVDSVDLVAAMVEWSDDALPARVLLVPGVRTDGARLEWSDVMRGEETEVVGLLSLPEVEPPLLYVSSGSHSKFVCVDGDGRIVWSVTTLSGELMWALHKETILADLVAVDAEDLDPEWVDEGARVTRQAGLTRALFVARVANRLSGVTPGQCSAFLHGAAAETDLRALEAALPDDRGRATIALRGGGPVRECYRQLLEQRPWVREVRLINQPLGAIGARVLYEARVRTGEEGRPLRA